MERKKRHNSEGFLLQLTIHLDASYLKSNLQYRPMKSSKCPRRILTKLADGVHNGGFDNANHEYICRVGDDIIAPNNEKYCIRERLGDGTFGQVVKCHVPEGKESALGSKFVAIKIIKNKPAYFHQALVEVNILRYLSTTFNHESIVKILDFFVFRKHLCIMFELLSFNLYDVLKQNNLRGLNLGVVRSLMRQLLECVEILQKAGLAHCDLKPENILLSGERETKIKLIDLGSACVDTSKTMHTYVQSRFYRSPEVLVAANYTLAIDMWSVGCICAELFLGVPVFPGCNAHDQVSQIVRMCGIFPAKMIEEGLCGREYFCEANELESSTMRMYRLRNPESRQKVPKQHLGDSRQKHLVRLRRSRSAPITERKPKELRNLKPRGHDPRGRQALIWKRGRETLKHELGEEPETQWGECEHEEQLKDHSPEDKLRDLQKNGRKGSGISGSNTSISTVDTEKMTEPVKDEVRYKLIEKEGPQERHEAKVQRGRPIFASFTQMMSYVPNRTKDKQFPLEENRRKAFEAFLKGLLQVNPEKRWSASQAIKHPFVTGDFEQDLDAWEPGPKGYESYIDRPRNLTAEWCRNIPLPCKNSAESYRPNIDLEDANEPPKDDCLPYEDEAWHTQKRPQSAPQNLRTALHQSPVRNSPGVRPMSGYDSSGSAYHKSNSPASRHDKRLTPNYYTMKPTPIKPLHYNIMLHGSYYRQMNQHMYGPAHAYNATPWEFNGSNLAGDEGYVQRHPNDISPQISPYLRTQSHGASEEVDPKWQHRTRRSDSDTSCAYRNNMVRGPNRSSAHPIQNAEVQGKHGFRKSRSPSRNSGPAKRGKGTPPTIAYCNRMSPKGQQRARPDSQPHISDEQDWDIAEGENGVDDHAQGYPYHVDKDYASPSSSNYMQDASTDLWNMEEAWAIPGRWNSPQVAWHEWNSDEWYAHSGSVQGIASQDSYDNLNAYQPKSNCDTPNTYNSQGHGGSTPTHWNGNYNNILALRGYYNWDAVSAGTQTASLSYTADGTPIIQSPMASYLGESDPVTEGLELEHSRKTNNADSPWNETESQRDESADNNWIGRHGPESASQRPVNTPSSLNYPATLRHHVHPTRQSPHKRQVASPATSFGADKRHWRNSPFSSRYSSCSSDHPDVLDDDANDCGGRISTNSAAVPRKTSLQRGDSASGDTPSAHENPIQTTKSSLLWRAKGLLFGHVAPAKTNFRSAIYDRGPVQGLPPRNHHKLSELPLHCDITNGKGAIRTPSVASLVNVDDDNARSEGQAKDGAPDSHIIFAC